ncbi:ATPase involved in DNA repair [Serratia plymuthica]|nr:ATPase involved in DNA repair [Serratia plymuthica]
MKIKKVEIEGFRAYRLKKDGVFDFTLRDGTPSNFVALYAPNGFGKSSFYDAVEWALTNNLERYAGEHAKKNNQIAARSTKQPQIPLKILRNKDIPDNALTKVNVITTRGDFPRQLKKLRSNSIDLDFGVTKNKRIEEGKSFGKIILSQDGIDRFLKEAKPQERYDLFMQYFGGEDEALRKEITALLTENNITLDVLNKQKSDAENQLSSPVDTAIFEKFNSIVYSLNQDGESIPLITESFDQTTEYNILSSIVERKHALSVSLVAERQRGISLQEQTSRLEEFQNNINVITEQNKRLTLINKGISDTQKYQTLSSTHENSIKNWKKFTGEVTELDSIEKLIPHFLVEEYEYRKADNEREVLVNQKTELDIKLLSAQTSAKQCQEALTETDQQLLILRTLSDNSPAIYSEIAVHQEALLKLQSDLQEKSAAITLAKSETERITRDLMKLSALSFSAENMFSQDSSLLGLSTDRLQRVYSAQQELLLLQQNDSAIRNSQVSLTRQKDAIEHIVNQGLVYLAEWPSDICPLCRIKHHSSDELTLAIKNNDLLTEVARLNAVQLEQIAARSTLLQHTINSAITEAKDKVSVTIIELKTKLSQQSSLIQSTEKDIHSLTAEINNTQHVIAALQLKVWNLKPKNLHIQLEAELSALSHIRNTQVDLLAAANSELAKIQVKINQYTTKLEELQRLVTSLNAKESFIKVVAFASKETVREYASLQEYCTEKRAQLEHDIKESSEKIKKLSAQCQELQQIMLNDGNWLDHQQLIFQREEISKIISNAKLIVDFFLDNVKTLLQEEIKTEPSTIHSKIELAIAESSSKTAYLTGKIERFELLTAHFEAFKPYLKRLESCKEIDEVSLIIAEHQTVKNKLLSDRELIFTELRERIKSFFFTDLINSIYSKIDPHPSFKKVEFIPDFEGTQPGLNIILKDETGDLISPMLYFSAAQLNILSLSVFLANALHAKDDKGQPLDVILIDDPIQSMDSINVLAVIDLFRNISLRFNKQIIISTHDENFFDLLQLKIPSEVLGSKFLQLESYGVVSQAQTAHDFVTGIPRASLTSDSKER